jgi:hypothetical protein
MRKCLTGAAIALLTVACGSGSNGPPAVSGSITVFAAVTPPLAETSLT